jgi:hypothetical protein
MQTFQWLLDIAAYEGDRYTEIIRAIIRDGIARYRQDRFFQRFMQKGEIQINTPVFLLLCYYTIYGNRVFYHSLIFFSFAS